VQIIKKQTRPSPARFKPKEMDKLRLYVTEAYDELMHKVSWPTWAELQQSAMVVLVAAVVMALMVVVMDVASKYGIQSGLYKILGH
jgi:preprotein translocase subunit SecE